jgi:hypothetical protein
MRIFVTCYQYSVENFGRVSKVIHDNAFSNRINKNAERLKWLKEAMTGRVMAQAVSRRPLAASAQSMWDLWWTMWHWDRFFPENFGFTLSVSFRRCSSTRKNEKKRIIFITGLHNEPEG